MLSRIRARLACCTARPCALSARGLSLGRGGEEEGGDERGGGEEVPGIGSASSLQKNCKRNPGVVSYRH